MLVIEDGFGGIILPFPIYHILELVCPGMKSQTPSKENLPLFVNLSVEFLKGLPFLPTPRDQNLVRNVLRVRLVDKIGLLCGTWTEMDVATLGANTWHL